EYDLVGPDGKTIAHRVVTATSGSGTRGTFDVTQPFTVTAGGDGKLMAYERSAENGKRIHVVEIPLQLEKQPPSPAEPGSALNSHPARTDPHTRITES